MEGPEIETERITQKRRKFVFVAKKAENGGTEKITIRKFDRSGDQNEGNQQLEGKLERGIHNKPMSASGGRGQEQSVGHGKRINEDSLR